MSRKNKTQNQPGKSTPFSEKENAIIIEELKDKEAYQRNLPLLLTLLKDSPNLRSIRINPFQVMMVMESRHRTVMANAAVGGQPVQDEQFIDMVVQDFSDQLNPHALLETLIPITKQTKIKREKRVLLWAAGEIIATIAEKKSCRESAAIRTIVLSSVQHSMGLSQLASNFIHEKEPFKFNYKQIMDDSFTEENWEEMLTPAQEYEPDFTFSMSQHASSLFQGVKKPFGVRFHRIIRYATAAKGTQRSILLPGETQLPQNDQNDEEMQRRMVEGLMGDFSPARRPEFIKDIISSIKNAAFGEIEDDKLVPLLNAVSYCFLSPLPANPFLMQLYQASGEKADQINPEDEKELIIDIKGSPANTKLYQRYAELLTNKKEYMGALQTYFYLQELLEKPDPAIEKIIEDLLEKAGEANSKEKADVENAEPLGDDVAPKSNIII